MAVVGVVMIEGVDVDGAVATVVVGVTIEVATVAGESVVVV